MAARLLVQGFVWSVTLIVARLLTPFDYGVMTAGMIFIGLADMLTEAGLGRALIQKEGLQPSDIAGAFTVSLALAVVFYAALCLLAPVAAAFLDLPLLTGFLPVLGVVVLTVPFRTTSLALLDRNLHLGRQAAIFVLCAVVQSSTVLCMAVLGFGYWALACGMLLARGLEAILLLSAARWRPRVMWPTQEHRGLVIFGVQASLGTILWFIYSNSDYAVISKLQGAVELGYYALAFQLMSLPVQKLTVNINQVAYPVFCRVQNDRALLRDWYLRLTVMLGSFGVPALVGLCLVAPDAIPVVLGTRWCPATVPFQLLSLVGIVMVHGASIPPLLNALGRPDIVLVYSAVCAVLFPTAFVLTGWQAGVMGVCVAWLALYPLVVLCLILWTKRLTGIGPRDLWQAFFPVLVAVLAMVLAVCVIRRSVGGIHMRLAAAIIGGALTYTATLLLIGRHTVLVDLRMLLRELRGRGVE